MDDSRSRESLLAFLDYCKDKGLMKPPTAEARKAAVNQVLGILGDDEASDVSKLDLDSLLRRFQNLHGKRYTPDSLKTYRARVKNSIEEFLRYLQNPMDFQPKLTMARGKTTSAKPVPLRVLSKRGERTADTVSRSMSVAPISMATLPIPIRTDLTILVHGLPFDLTPSEAKKIANVIQAMATV